MFTGIIQSTGTILSLESRGDALTMKLSAPGFFKGCNLGDSVANDGVCLSIESCTDDEATFCLMHQTVENTSFKQAEPGKLVNLEKACRADSFMGGHFVMGHVDTSVKVLAVANRETGVEVDLELPKDLRRYVIRRGSVSLNGISLTVAEKFEDSIRVCIIPETLARTNLRNWVPGTIVNVEVDMLGKYIENYLKERDLA
ncbi:MULTISPECIES: riboflavin synthase [unclassified Fibrobacter]|uniref:riboflavin synthase n=1 Tax=unclassified Fibrobacter TaxID=2634177 RepID=UPI000D6D5BEB|nr:MULTISPECIES: riboflavin synthase [unclassified Fibrobacter]PWJ71865.1 riboflavin synthase alpha chain [Fibrobacter sp. UWR4]PZW73780.1 riboflavin synthase alpha chain [Fibrobacter sp. UWR1]